MTYQNKKIIKKSNFKTKIVRILKILGVIVITLQILLIAIINIAPDYFITKFEGAFFVDKYLLALKGKDIPVKTDKIIRCDVLVIGGGTGGTAAAIQSARLGEKTCLVEETDWLGGMITAAGVSSLDGNDWNYTGILKEFVDNVQEKYKSRPLETKRCFAPFCFEPHVGHEVIKKMVKDESNIKLFLNTKLEKVLKKDDRIEGIIAKDSGGKTITFTAKITIEATELGDVLYLGEVPFDVGLDPDSNEPHYSIVNNCIQPITTVAIIRDTGEKQKSIEKPKNYYPENYRCMIPNPKCPNSPTKFESWEYFLGYGQFPLGKVMVNVPSHSFGNDFDPEKSEFKKLLREEIIQKSKDYTLGLIYYIQTEFGKNTYELVNEFRTADSLAVIPYIRESRRVKGVKRIQEGDILPNAQTGQSRFWNDSIAVGDYPLDIHACGKGERDVFLTIPPFQVSYGVLVPEKIDGLLVAEKNISVSHIANGATRLQPITMSIGQAAGAAAAIAAKKEIEPREIDISELQKKLVEADSRINFYWDIPTDHPAFKAISILTQKRIVSGYGNNYFGTNKKINRGEFATMLIQSFGKHENSLLDVHKKFRDIKETDWMYEYAYGLPASLKDFFLGYNFDANRSLTRGQAAHWIKEYFKFEKTSDEQYAVPIFSDLTSFYEYKDDIEILASLGILKGNNDGRYHPYRPTTRAEAAMMIYRLLNETK